MILICVIGIALGFGFAHLWPVIWEHPFPFLWCWGSFALAFLLARSNKS